jgi:hypothetical protein
MLLKSTPASSQADSKSCFAESGLQEVLNETVSQVGCPGLHHIFDYFRNGHGGG